MTCGPMRLLWTFRVVYLTSKITNGLWRFEPSEMSCSNSIHLSDNERKSKERDDRGKNSAIQWPGSSRVEDLRVVF